MEVRGSSPLARGLRLGRIRLVHRPGIIPARAGFTRRARQEPPELQDHPRSRGVYRTLVRAETGAEGSSPLARGLRTTSCSSTSRSRIIPARAGFTATGRRGRR